MMEVAMRGPWYVGAAVLGLLGLLGLVRAVELLVVRGSMNVIGFALSLLFLAGALACGKRARAS
jgi:hypothetical protein